MENTSLRDPIRSATFIGPSGEQPSAIVGSSLARMQDENNHLATDNHFPEKNPQLCAHACQRGRLTWGSSAGLLHARAARPRMISYRSMTAATPMLGSSSSGRCSTRITL